MPAPIAPQALSAPPANTFVPAASPVCSAHLRQQCRRHDRAIRPAAGRTMPADRTRQALRRSTACPPHPAAACRPHRNNPYAFRPSAGSAHNPSAAGTVSRFAKTSGSCSLHPQNFRQRKPFQRRIARDAEQIVSPSIRSISRHSRRRPRVVPQNRVPDRPIRFVQQHQAVHLAGEADAFDFIRTHAGCCRSAREARRSFLPPSLPARCSLQPDMLMDTADIFATLPPALCRPDRPAAPSTALVPEIDPDHIFHVLIPPEEPVAPVNSLSARTGTNSRPFAAGCVDSRQTHYTL